MGRDVRRELGVVGIHASERDVESGCLLGSEDGATTTSSPSPLYTALPLANEVIILRQRGENPFPQYTPSKSRFSLKNTSHHVLHAGAKVEDRQYLV